MTGLPARIVGLARLTLQDPRKAIRVLQAEDVPLPARTLGLLLMAVLSALLLQPSFLLLPPTDDAMGFVLAQSPLRTAVIQWVILLISALLIHRVGKAFGGTGNLPDAILIVVWLQLIMLGVQILQLLSLVLLPPLSGIVGIAGFVLFLYLLVSFIAELHGFASRGAVLAGVIVTFFAAAFVAALVLGAFLGPMVPTDV